MKSISFSKYSGCGNDFILVDNRDHHFPVDDKNLIQDFCRRSFGIGADGLILFEQNTQGSYLMRIFNADGGEAEMCGNGLRCFGLFLKEKGVTENAFKVEVMGKVYSVSIDPEGISVTMVPPSKIQWDITLSLDKKKLLVDYLDTGVPHVVQFVENIDKVNVEKLGPLLRYHEQFAPKGTNVDFATLHSHSIIHMRTYERGVEGETFACGTGACAVAIAAARKYQLKSPIQVKTRSGETLDFDLTLDNGQVKKVIMRGPAKQVYSGIVDVEE